MHRDRIASCSFAGGKADYRIHHVIAGRRYRYWCLHWSTISNARWLHAATMECPSMSCGPHGDDADNETPLQRSTTVQESNEPMSDDVVIEESILSGSLSKLPALGSRTVCVFLSSTFSGLLHYSHIFPTVCILSDVWCRLHRPIRSRRIMPLRY